MGMETHKRFGAALLLLTSVVLMGCHKNDPPPAATGNPIATPPAQTAEAPAQAETASKTPLQDALEKLIEKETASDASLFPKGTKLRSVNLKEGVATLDFNAEFNKLETLGDSTASEAQKQLRNTLAPFNNVEKMRVTVEGKPFDSQMTDWSTPFPVRDSPETARDTNPADGGNR